MLILPLHVDQRLEHFVGDGDDLRVALETALGDDHGGELVGDFSLAFLHTVVLYATILQKRCLP